MRAKRSPTRRPEDYFSKPGLRNLVYRFGFLCLDARLENAPARQLMAELGWSHTAVGHLTLWTHPETRRQFLGGVDRRLALIGEVYEVATGAPPVHAPPAGDAALFAFADGLTGRFALLVVESDRARVLHDAIGSRSVFYRRGGGFAAASHASLLASATGVGAGKT